MNHLKPILSIILIFLMNAFIHAEPVLTKRTTQFSNDRVLVWETVIYPSENQALKMHRHNHDRVVVAFDDGLLKITNDKGSIHYLKLEKNKAYYLSKDIPDELHKDENMSFHPIRVLVIELKGQVPA